MLRERGSDHHRHIFSQAFFPSSLRKITYQRSSCLTLVEKGLLKRKKKFPILYTVFRLNFCDFFFCPWEECELELIDLLNFKYVHSFATNDAFIFQLFFCTAKQDCVIHYSRKKKNCYFMSKLKRKFVLCMQQCKAVYDFLSFLPQFLLLLCFSVSRQCLHSLFTGKA